MLKGHLPSKFIEQLEMQSTCPFHCLSWLLQENESCKYCTNCIVCIEQFKLFDDLQAIVGSNKLPKEIDKTEANVQLFIGHSVRGKYQQSKFMKKIEQVGPGEPIAICYYMMSYYFSNSGTHNVTGMKKGDSLHGTMFLFRFSDSREIEVEIHDLFTNGDCVQNWFFTVSAFEATLKDLAAKHDDIKKLSIWWTIGFISIILLSYG